jgi:hypothetical protein
VNPDPAPATQPLAPGGTAAGVALTLVFWLALTAFVYRDTQTNFLRAESGWYLLLSHSNAATQDDFIHTALTKSFSGHYAPIAFLAEFSTAKVVGTSAAFWKWRQVVLVAIVATAIHLLTRQAARLLNCPPGPHLTATAAAVAALIVFQPNMKDFVAWPFMSLQLFWLLLTILTLAALLQAAVAPDESRWRWLAAGAAYASLHFLGLGLATVAATAVVLAADIARRWRSGRRSKDLIPLATLVLVTALHGIVMLTLMRAEVIPAAPASEPAVFLKSAFAFLPNFAVAAVRGWFSLAQPMADTSWMRAQWPYGAFFLLLAFLVIGVVWFRDLRQTTVSPQSRVRSTLVVFSIVCFLSVAALIAARVLRYPGPRGFADFLVGSRYLLPANSTLIGLIIILFVGVAKRIPPRLHLALAAIIVLTAVLGQDEYRRHIYSQAEPLSAISHDATWRSIVTMARQSRDAGLPVPNAPMEKLTQDFPGWDLKLFEPLLRAELGERQGAAFEFADWKQLSANLPGEYANRVPALLDVVRNLQLPPMNATPGDH